MILPLPQPQQAWQQATDWLAQYDLHADFATVAEMGGLQRDEVDQLLGRETATQHILQRQILTLPYLADSQWLFPAWQFTREHVYPVVAAIGQQWHRSLPHLPDDPWCVLAWFSAPNPFLENCSPMSQLPDMAALLALQELSALPVRP